MSYDQEFMKMFLDDAFMLTRYSFPEILDYASREEFARWAEPLAKIEIFLGAHRTAKALLLDPRQRSRFSGQAALQFLEKQFPATTKKFPVFSDETIRVLREGIDSAGPFLAIMSIVERQLEGVFEKV